VTALLGRLGLSSKECEINLDGTLPTLLQSSFFFSSSNDSENEIYQLELVMKNNTNIGSVG